MSEKTIGEKRVRTDFNVATGATSNKVDQAKEMCAQLINFVNDNKEQDPRLAAIAMTEIEGACHWIVKLVTA